MDLGDPGVIGDMLEAMPDGCSVSYGGTTTGGNFEHVPEPLFEQPSGVVAAPSVVVPASAFPEIGLNDERGRLRGIGKTITIESDRLGKVRWEIANIEPGLAPGEIRLLLTNP